MHPSTIHVNPRWYRYPLQLGRKNIFMLACMWSGKDGEGAGRRRRSRDKGAGGNRDEASLREGRMYDHRGCIGFMINSLLLCCQMYM